ncbi:Fungal specific transcription factor domain-containing protein [Pleurostoma richardsiae]|uniref:Fungal specific transcription factor domain-containing protein n=1 Tax=Pleurostoma richardsiae TaxID=41990 RepID=A0AA38RQ77_9PEZI|nr:Fungal specific transcription factor domain-containing protein [Pleurostoma richardsiae]
MREIERLRNRVKELEEKLESRSDTSSQDSYEVLGRAQVSAPPSRPQAPTSDNLRDHGSRAVWEGTYTSTAKSSQTQWYGPASAMHFVSRMSRYLGTAFHQPCPHRHMQPKTASMSFSSPTSEFDENYDGHAVLADAMRVNGDLTGTQEDYFLGLFWQSYHCTFQILDEAEFREHYRSLWTATRTTRRPSALVDIVLALCMQLGVSSRPRADASSRGKTEIDSSDASIAGRWLYRRSQMLLSSELESPAISTLQCQIYAALYLCNASFQNMAHSTLALALRTAQILGLHLEPPADMPRAQRELRKMIWWTLYAVEIKTCMKLGRPWSAQLSDVTCTLPADDPELAFLSSSSFASIGGSVTWLSYGVQMIKVILAAREVYVAFYSERERLLGSIQEQAEYDGPELKEPLANLLASKMKGMTGWVRELPDALKTKRKGGVQPYSTGETLELDIEVFAPLWLQRQRLLLELLYHNLCMNLLRPVICFFPRGFAPQKVADLAVQCVHHAITITNIMHQALAQTDILTGWHEAFQWQWNATLTMLGFILANPVHGSTPAVRRAVDVATENFDFLGNNLAMASSSAAVTRDLAAKGDLLTNRLMPGLHAMVPFGSSAAVTPSSGALAAEELRDTGSACPPTADAAGLAGSTVSNTDALSFEEPSAMLQDALAGYLGLAFNDSFNSFDGFLVDNSAEFLSDGWDFNQSTQP